MSDVPLMSVHHLRKAMGPAGRSIEVLRDVTLEAAEGEFICVVGPSGCGKTTLLMCLAGLMPADGGRLTFAGRELTQPPAGLAVVFQDYSRSLLPWRNNLDNVLFGMRRVLDLSRSQRDALARELLNSVGLFGYEKHYPWQVSGGMQQRVAIARGLASRSRLLLLDEPLAAVDAQTRADMQDLLLSLAARYRQTCILVTHDVDEAVFLADKVVVLSNRPTTVVREFQVPLAKPRDQIASKEDPHFLHLRHEILSMIRSMRAGATAAA